MSQIPKQENCNPEDPRDAFRWAFVALPFAGSTPLIVDPNVIPDWSQLLWDLGFRHHPELQTKRVIPPPRGPEMFNPAVLVVDKDAPDPDPVVIQDPATLNAHEQEIQLERYRQIGRLPAEGNPGEGAELYGGNLFNPSDHSPSTVIGYLMAASPAERRRVLAAEMCGRKRDRILRTFPGE